MQVCHVSSTAGYGTGVVFSGGTGYGYGDFFDIILELILLLIWWKFVFGKFQQNLMLHSPETVICLRPSTNTIHLCLLSHKTDIDKQCRPDQTPQSAASGRNLLCLNYARISIKHDNNKKKAPSIGRAISSYKPSHLDLHCLLGYLFCLQG